MNSGTNALITVLGALNAEKPALPSFTCRALLDACWGFAELADNACDIPRADFDASNFPPCDVAIVSHMFGTAKLEIEGKGVPPRKVVQDITLSLGGVPHIGIGVCSFYRDKMITTGRGGIIVSNDEALLQECRELAYYDQQKDAYRVAFSFGMTPLQAQLGRSQLRQLPAFIERRREIAARYTHAFSEIGIETPNRECDSVFFRYIIGVDDPGGKVELLARRGIEAGRGVNPPLHRILGLPREDFPGAEQCLSRLLSVPCHPGLSDADVQRVVVGVLETCAP